MSEQLEFLKTIAARLDSAGIPYMITGSMAMALYARPRMTRDIDLVVECGATDAGALVRSNRDLDWEYLERWSAELGVRESIEGMRGR